MSKKEKVDTFMLGNFIKELRERKSVSLKEVENATKIPNAYLSQLETGARKKLPDPDRLRILADYFNVTIKELLEKAGYVEATGIQETLEQKIEKAFQHVIHDPSFQYGTRVKGEYDLDAKRFIIEMYEKVMGKNLL